MEEALERDRRKGGASTGIVVAGSVFVDIKGYPLGEYVPDGRNAGRIVQVHGGVSRNVAEDIANIGYPVTFVSVVDHSGISTDVLERLEKEGVNTKYMRRVENGLGTWLALFNSRGDVAGSISGRPDLSEIGRIFEEHGDEIVAGADSIIVEVDMDPGSLETIFELAERYGKDVYAVVANMSIASERREFLRRTKCIVCNLQESGVLFEKDYEGISAEELLAGMKAQMEKEGLFRLIVTLGPDGAVYAEQGGPSGYCPAIDTEVVDTSGAGDSFFAGAAVALTCGRSLPEACELGTRLAASTIATLESACPRFQPEELGV